MCRSSTSDLAKFTTLFGAGCLTAFRFFFFLSIRSNYVGGETGAEALDEWRGDRSWQRFRDKRRNSALSFDVEISFTIIFDPVPLNKRREGFLPSYCELHWPDFCGR